MAWSLELDVGTATTITRGVPKPKEASITCAEAFCGVYESPTMFSGHLGHSGVI